MPGRKVHVAGEVWRYQIGRRYVRIKSSNGKPHYVNKEKLVWADVPVKMPGLYGDLYKVNAGLTPSVIKKYIEVVLVKKSKWFPKRYLTSKLIREYKYSSLPNAMEYSAA